MPDELFPKQEDQTRFLVRYVARLDAIDSMEETMEAVASQGCDAEMQRLLVSPELFAHLASDPSDEAHKKKENGRHAVHLVRWENDDSPLRVAGVDHPNLQLPASVVARCTQLHDNGQQPHRCGVRRNRLRPARVCGSSFLW